MNGFEEFVLIWYFSDWLLYILSGVADWLTPDLEELKSGHN